MRKLIEMKTTEKDDHRMYIYEGDKKIPVPDDGVVFCYLSKTGMLKTTEWPDRAGSVDGRFVVTDEITNDHGKPCVNGHTYDIFGAEELGVYLSVTRDELYHTMDTKTDSRGANRILRNPEKKAELEQLRQIYMMLK